MIEVIARVEQADKKYIWLQRNNSSQCQRCQQGNGCGGAIWGKLLPVGKLLRLPNQLGAQTGNRLRLTISESRFLWMSALAYFLPLIWLLTLAGVGHFLGGEVGAITAAGLAIAAWLVAVRSLLVPLTAANIFQGVEQALVT
ncbi:MAG: hypothetical protein DRQ54_02005 [Gammaproteobacteria bacterium]|nr:MAG: hypothetical protein DRQ54_02005 [Gammaproteobacteria bacterium]RLA14942.1 MAG: hypothetical protein DRQ52_02950 [Gammaproteobacteria bacterium]